MDDPDLAPSPLDGLVEIVGERIGHILRTERVQVEGILNRDSSLFFNHPITRSPDRQIPHTSSITTVTGIAAFATFEMMQYFSASARVFST